MINLWVTVIQDDRMVLWRCWTSISLCCWQWFLETIILRHSRALTGNIVRNCDANLSFNSRVSSVHYPRKLLKEINFWFIRIFSAITEGIVSWSCAITLTISLVLQATACSWIFGYPCGVGFFDGFYIVSFIWFTWG